MNMNLNLKYQVPFTLVENYVEGNQSNDFFIEGIAINSTTTDNNHKFVAEELKSAAYSLIGRPLLTDHDDKLKSMAGKVIGAEYDEMTQAIRFKAKLNNTEQGKLAKELIRSGDLNTVSIGANVTSFDESEESIIPRGIKFKELSLVAVPADDNAQFSFKGQTLDLALKEAWISVHESNENIIEQKVKCPECDMMIEKDKMQSHMKKMHSDKMDMSNKSNSSDFVADNNKDERRFEMEEDKKNIVSETVEVVEVKEEKVIEYVSKEEFKAQAELITSILERLSLIESTKVEVVETKEAPVTEAVTETVKVEVKEVSKVDTEEADVEEDEEDTIDENDKSEYRIVQGFKSFTVEKKKYR